MAVFPPIAGVDLSDERRRHGRPCDAAHVRRGRGADDVGRRAAAERDERAVAADPKRGPQTLEDGGRLGRLARRHLVLLDVSRAEGDLRAYPVDPGDVRVGDELHRPLARHEPSEVVDRAELDVHAGRREEQPVDVARPRVGDVLVERLAVSVERVEGVLVLRERPVAARRPAARPSRDRRRAAP